MPKYRLSEAADKDLSDIYAYTYLRFGEMQADAYFAGLEDALTTLAENPQLGIDVSAIREGYRRLIFERHSVFYKVSKSGVLVVRILGPGMAVEQHLP